MEKIANGSWKKFRRYKDAAAYYGMSQKVLERLAKDAHATYKLGKIVFVNCEMLEEYFELFRIAE